MACRQLRPGQAAGTPVPSRSANHSGCLLRTAEFLYPPITLLSSSLPSPLDIFLARAYPCVPECKLAPSPSPPELPERETPAPPAQNRSIPHVPCETP